MPPPWPPRCSSPRWPNAPASTAPASPSSPSTRPSAPGARPWAQTERIRACARAAALTGDGALWAATVQACEALEAFLDTPTPGLWRDWRDETGAFREEAAPASSLYH